jgi:GT2 family glycosyltransferase
MESVKTLEYEVIIIDNNSPDKQLPLIEKTFPQDFIHFYYLEQNVGFGKGCNYGFTKATGEFICFLNPDIIVREDIFTPIIQVFKDDKTVGIIGPEQLIRKSFFDFSAGYNPTLLLEILNLIGLGIYIEGAFMFCKVRLSSNKSLKVNWILGACLMMKSDLFSSIGGFDKDYFMFFEEVDLCRRVLNKGLTVLYLPYLKIYHIGSVSGRKDYTLYTIRTYISKYMYISKHFFSIKNYIMKSLLDLQLFNQIIIWIILYPFNTQKSKQKLRAFIYLLKRKFLYSQDESAIL